ncbi:MAG: RluA family pseudouridine synthase [Candidatus Xenobium sp.]|jgi:23S rRNA pseudouridine1911/1915/1917 synthase
MPRRDASSKRRPPQEPPGLADLSLRFRTVVPERLDEALRLRLPQGISRSRVRSWVLAGAVRIQGSPIRNPAWVLPPGARVELRVKRPAPQAVPELGPERILFEDEDLLVVDKPAGLPMHANLDPTRPHLLALLETFLAQRDGQAGYLGIHQRLDLSTSGVVLLARSLLANPGLARQFEGRLVRKSYLALVRATGKNPLPSWIEARPLGAPLRRGGAVPVLESGGSAARTDFTVLASAGRALLVQACPQTGRKHQIRAHLAGRGLPILGDALYGGPRRVGTVAVARPMLHAWRLELQHPLSARPLCFEAPLPEDFSRLAEELGVLGVWRARGSGR